MFLNTLVERPSGDFTNVAPNTILLVQFLATLQQREESPQGARKTCTRSFDGFAKCTWYTEVIRLTEIATVFLKKWYLILLVSLFIACSPLGFIKTNSSKTLSTAQNTFLDQAKVYNIYHFTLRDAERESASEALRFFFNFPNRHEASCFCRSSPKPRTENWRTQRFP